MNKLAGIGVYIQEVVSTTPKALREYGKYLEEDMIEECIIVLGTVYEDKALLHCRVLDKLTDRFSAGAIMKDLCKYIGGAGGGRKDMAEGSGPKVSELGMALAVAYLIIS